jgi:hypothetical protein
MDITLINDTINLVRTHAPAIGYGIGAGTVAYTLSCGAWGMSRGTTFLQELRRPRNILPALAVGTAAGISLDGIANDATYYGQAAKYLGVAATGATAGAMLRPVARSLRTTDSVLDNLEQRAREGAVRGAITFPVAYGLLETLAKYIR